MPIDIWKFMAGLGLFLFGIQLVEISLKYLAGRHFKKLIRKHTENKFKSILAGTLSTIVLQSSSAVTLMLLALVGSGVLALSNALGIILGANLGTTFTGWVVSTFGFKVNIDSAIFPVVAIGALLHVFLGSRRLFSDWGKFILGIGLLFFGISLMKDSVISIKDGLSFERFQVQNIYLYALGGFLFTAVIQSSSATMAIALTALNASLLPLSAAAALIVGADLGTTITTMLGSAGGTAEKKQVAAAHLIYNLVTCLLALLFLNSLLRLVTYVIGADNPLYSLVLFQSTFNFIGILLFWPFLNQFSRFLERKFSNIQDRSIVLDIDPQRPESAIESLSESIKRFAAQSLAFNLSALGNNHTETLKDAFKIHPPKSLQSQYSRLKEIESALVSYSIGMQKESLSEQQSRTLQLFSSAVRNLSYSRKSLKDILHNVEEFNNSSNDSVHEISECMTLCSKKVFGKLTDLLKSGEQLSLLEGLFESLNENENGFLDFVSRINNKIKERQLPEKYIPNLFNANRELHSSAKFMILAIGEIYLSSDQVESVYSFPSTRRNLGTEKLNAHNEFGANV